MPKNAGREIYDRKMQEQFEGVENAVPENAGRRHLRSADTK